MKKQLANLVTLARVALAIPAVILHQQGSTAALGWMIPIMFVAELTDLIDGKIARHYSEVTRAGKYLDPMADSIYRASLFASFTVAGWIPLWMLLVFVWRDIMVAYLRLIAADVGVVVSARWSGKIKAVVQAGAQFFSIVAAWAVAHFGAAGGRVPAIGLSAVQLAFWLCLIAAAVTLWSGVDYIVGIRKQLKALVSDELQ